MKKLAFVFSLLLVLSSVRAQEDFRKMAPKPGPAPKIELGDYEQFTMNNGLQLIVVENEKLPRVSYQLFIDLPLIKEGEYSGAADMMGGLLRSGTTEYTKAQIDESIDFIGASLSTSASGMFGTALSRHKETLMRIMAEVALTPTFPEDEFEKIKRQTLSALQQAKDDPGAIANNLGRAARYGADHPYGEITTPETVENIDRDKVVEFYNTYFTPKQSYLVIVGDIETLEARSLAEKYFGEWTGEAVAETEYARPKSPGKTRVAMVDRPSAVQTTINITYPVNLKPGTADVLPAAVLNTVLGSSFNGRLFSNLREDKGYTYGAYSQINPDEYVGSFTASANVRNEVTDSAIVEFMYELDRIAKEPVSEEEIQRAKNMIAGSFARQLESPQTIAQYALNIARYDLPEDYYKNYLKRLSEVTVDDVLEAAHRYITPERANIVIVGSDKEIGEKLVRFDDDATLTYYDAYGREKQDVELTVPAGMTAQDVLDKYIINIGGKDQLMAVRDMTTEMSTNVQGMAVNMTLQQKQPGKMSMVVSASGMTMNETKVNGEEAKVMAMGQPQPLDDAAKKGLIEQAVIFPEVRYDKLGITAKLVGAEMVEKTPAYVLAITSPTGKTVTEYYSIDTGMKIRSVASEGGQTQMSDYADYKAVNGIMIPHKVTSTGMAPFPLEMKVEKVEINSGIDDAAFKIE